MLGLIAAPKRRALGKGWVDNWVVRAGMVGCGAGLGRSMVRLAGIEPPRVQRHDRVKAVAYLVHLAPVIRNRPW